MCHEKGRGHWRYPIQQNKFMCASLTDPTLEDATSAKDTDEEGAVAVENSCEGIGKSGANDVCNKAPE